MMNDLALTATESYSLISDLQTKLAARTAEVAQLGQAERSLADARICIEHLMSWMSLSPSWRYEQLRDRFYRETGLFPPGSSEPLEIGNLVSLEDRTRAWELWLMETRQADWEHAESIVMAGRMAQ